MNDMLNFDSNFNLKFYKSGYYKNDLNLYFLKPDIKAVPKYSKGDKLELAVLGKRQGYFIKIKSVKRIRLQDITKDIVELYAGVFKDKAAFMEYWAEKYGGIEHIEKNPPMILYSFKAVK